MQIETPWNEAKPGDVVARQPGVVCRMVQRGIRRKSDAQAIVQAYPTNVAHVWLDGPKKWAVVRFERA